MDLNEQVAYRVRENVVATDVDGGQVLLDLENGQYFSLNATASTIWQGIADSKSVAEIVERILTVYDVDREHCVHDVSTIIEGLRSSGLIEQKAE